VICRKLLLELGKHLRLFIALILSCQHQRNPVHLFSNPYNPLLQNKYEKDMLQFKFNLFHLPVQAVIVKKRARATLTLHFYLRFSKVLKKEPLKILNRLLF